MGVVLATWTLPSSAGRELPSGLTAHDWAHEGQPMHAVSAGDPSAAPLLFVHGSPGSWDAFEDYLLDPELQARAQLIAVDRPGFGGSGAGEAVPSLSAQAAAVMSALAINRSHRPAVMIGHSLGGPVIARAAMDAPDQVGALLLLAPSVDPDLEVPRWYNRLADLRAIAWLLPRGARTSNEEIMPLRGELEAMLPTWSHITQPVTLLHGARDSLVPVENADFVEQALPHARVVRVPDEDHFIPWTQRAQVTAELLALLDAIP